MKIKFVKILLHFCTVAILYSCKDPCDGVICQNGGTTVSNNRSCSCNCVGGFTGDNCEDVDGNLLVGPYRTSGYCIAPGYSYTAIYIHNPIPLPSAITISTKLSVPCLSNEFHVELSGNLDGSSITIPIQTVPYNSGGANVDIYDLVSIKGSGKISSSGGKISIELNYDIHVEKYNYSNMTTCDNSCNTKFEKN